MQTLDAIICTYNRAEKVNQLVEQLLQTTPAPRQIIVVDSSDNDNEILMQNSQVKYLKSDRKSQPYQRYLGAINSDAEVLVFFDDDVKILINTLFDKVQEGFSNNEVVGVSLGIFYENGIELNKSTNSNKNKENNSGKISWLGRTTGLPNKDMIVEYFPGPIMAFRRRIVFELFDEYLFTIFEKRIAMGEDKVISMRASQFGKLIYFGANDYLYHPPEPSTYFDNEINFIAKTTFSRLWINKVYAKVRKKKVVFAYLYFIGYLTKQILNSYNNINKFKGNIRALKLVLIN